MRPLSAKHKHILQTISFLMNLVAVALLALPLGLGRNVVVVLAAAVIGLDFLVEAVQIVALPAATPKNKVIIETVSAMLNLFVLALILGATSLGLNMTTALWFAAGIVGIDTIVEGIELIKMP